LLQVAVAGRVVVTHATAFVEYVAEVDPVFLALFACALETATTTPAP
jgi:hypothetical protein